MLFNSNEAIMIQSVWILKSNCFFPPLRVQVSFVGSHTLSVSLIFQCVEFVLWFFSQFLLFSGTPLLVNFFLPYIRALYFYITVSESSLSLD